MKKIISFIKSTIILGLTFIVPTVLLIYLIVKVIGIIRQVLAPIANRIDISFLGGDTTARIIATIVLLLLCFIIGILAKRKRTNPIKDWVENNILSNIPGYTLLKGMTETAAGFNSNDLKEVVLVNIEEVWQVGFLMDRIDNDLNAVFIPGAPNVMAGEVVIVKWGRLKKLDIDEINVIKLYRKLGLDSKKILDGKLHKSIFENE